jgi:ribonuclease H2 subunit A
MSSEHGEHCEQTEQTEQTEHTERSKQTEQRGRICQEVIDLTTEFKCRMTMRVPEAMHLLEQTGESSSECEPVVLGIDEAGRGCVLGSMVYGAVFWPESTRVDAIRSLGLNDSKQLTARQRQLALVRCVETEWLGSITLEIFADQLSRAMDSGTNLNQLSHRMIVALCRQVQHLFRVKSVSCDTVGPEGTLQAIIQGAVGRGVDVLVKARADSLFPQVSAASIFAKETRDALL